jgi:hypothetical protein
LSSFHRLDFWSRSAALSLEMEPSRLLGQALRKRQILITRVGLLQQNALTKVPEQELSLDTLRTVTAWLSKNDDVVKAKNLADQIGLRGAHPALMIHSSVRLHPLAYSS